MFANLITAYDLSSYFGHNNELFNSLTTHDGIEKIMDNSYLFHLLKSSQYLAELQNHLKRHRPRDQFQIIYSEVKPSFFIHSVD